jgi:FixJ family two-component response regulator
MAVHALSVPRFTPQDLAITTVSCGPRQKDYTRLSEVLKLIAMREGVQTSPATPSAEDAIVFVVDDDQDMRTALCSLFRSIGLRVKTFTAATELLQHQLPAVPSCLVCDIRLPRMSGLDLQTELSRLGITIPIIFITAHADIPMSVRAMKAGANDFLTKPYRDQEMLDAVTKAIERDRQCRIQENFNADIRTKFTQTVKIHRGSVMRKMKAKSLADLILMAERLGIRGQGKPVD